MDNQYKLLIIDDNEEILSTLYDYFKTKYNVVTASNGLDGLKLIEKEKKGFDLVITDIVMPNISGIGIISIIKQKNPDAPIVAITGWGKYPELLAIEVQADLVLEKPFNLLELDRHVAELIKKTIRPQIHTDERR